MRGRGGIDPVAGDNQGIHAVGLHGFQQPVQEGLLLGEALLAGKKVLAEVPVGGVKDAHLRKLPRRWLSGKIEVEWRGWEGTHPLKQFKQLS